MKILYTTGFLVIFFFLFFNTDSHNLVMKQKPENFSEKAQKLIRAYPDFLCYYADNQIVWKDSTRILFDDGQVKTFEQMLNNADLQDQLSQKYTVGKFDTPMHNFDPGRIRSEAFFRKMYGNSKMEVEKNLVTITWLPKLANKKIKVSKINSVDKKILAISEELDNKAHLKKYLDNPAGAYYWRKISGTNNLSMHSFGIAIDINVSYSNYWLWDSKKSINLKYRNQIPMEIVEVFEKHGFIWGGKWYHYDTMHFEYRPELIEP